MARRRRVQEPPEPAPLTEEHPAGPSAAGAVGRVIVVGLGPAGPALLAPSVLERLAGAGRAYLRTSRHPAAVGLDIASFDDVYDTAAGFEEVYARIVDTLVAAATSMAAAGGEVVYAVPGSPLVAERTVELLRADPRVEVTVVPALSFLDLAWERLGVDPLAASVRLVDGTRFSEQAAGERGPLLVAQCWSPTVLSQIKLSVEGDRDPPAVTVLHHLGLGDERVEQCAWAELDHRGDVDHLTSLWIPELPSPPGAELVALVELVRTLRARCPWDREQTHGSLSAHLLEESYEVLDAIEGLEAAETSDPPFAEDVTAVTSAQGAAAAHLEEELGDLLFQIYFHAELATEAGQFTLGDVARGIFNKLVARHPHVFGDAPADDAGQVVERWEQAKLAEKGRQSVADGIPPALPALAYAATLQRKALSVPGVTPPGFEARRDEVRRAVDQLAPGGNGSDDLGQIGGLLFAVADLARQLGVDPESALRASVRRFENEVRESERSP